MKSEEAMTKRTGRPKSSEKHEAIIEAAGKCFLEQGLAATSMDEVARRAGVSKQTVYSHFQSKEDLFQAVIAGKCRRYTLETTEMPGDRDLESGLLDFTRRYLDLVLDPQVVAMTRQLIAQSTKHPQMVELYRRAGPIPTMDCLARLLTEARDRGRLNLEDADTAAADYIHETGARFKNELLMNLRDGVSVAEREAHARRRVTEFLKLHGSA